MLRPIAVGVLVIVATVVIHAVGSTWWIRLIKNRFTGLKDTMRPRSILTVLMSTALVLLSLHTLEILLWALTYILLPLKGQLPNLADSLYFSFVTFTTLGYGDITLIDSWRLLSGIEAMNGILLFGWSTAMLFAVVQRLWRDMHNVSE